MDSPYRKHLIRKRKCKHLDRRAGSDWVTCLHPNNPVALKICSHEHCPKAGGGNTVREIIIQWFVEDIKENLTWLDVDDMSNDRIREIAEEKTDDLMSKIFLEKESTGLTTKQLKQIMNHAQ